MKTHKIYVFFLILIVLAAVGAVILRADSAWKAITWDLPFNKKVAELDTQNQDDRSPFDHRFVTMGGYSLEGEFAEVEDLFALDHYFVNWIDYSTTSLSNSIQSTIDNDRWPLITIEPFTEGNVEPETYLSNIVFGDYDETIISICSDIGSTDHPVIIRFMHEMDHEANAGRYPWVTDDAPLFITAYKHFVDLCDHSIEEAYYMWSPVGSDTLANYYPGDDYVDMIGLSLYSLPEWEIKNYKKVLDFDSSFGDKYRRVQDYNKKVVLAEFAVAQSGDHQKNFITDMALNIEKYPLLDTVVYFNAKEPYPEGWGLSSNATIDWRIENINDLRMIKGDE